MSILAFVYVLAAVMFGVWASKSGIKRDSRDGVFGGVCAGLAKHYDVPANALRIVLLASILLFGVGLAAYIIMCIILASE